MRRVHREATVGEVHATVSPLAGESPERWFLSPRGLDPANGRHHAPHRRDHTHHGERDGVGEKQDPSCEGGFQHGSLRAVTVRNTITLLISYR